MPGTSSDFFGSTDLPESAIPPALVVAGSTTVVPSTDSPAGQEPVMYATTSLQPANGGVAYGDSGQSYETQNGLPTVAETTSIGNVTTQPGVPATSEAAFDLKSIPPMGWLAIGILFLIMVRK